MLIARATAEVARLIAADAILGIPYVTEELDDGDQDGAPPPAEEDTKASPPRKTARRRTAQVAQNGAPAPASIEAPKQEDDEPPLEDAVGPHVDEPAGGHMVGYMDEPPFDDGPPPITKGQMQALQAGFRMLGIDRAERLKIVRQAGRPSRKTTRRGSSRPRISARLRRRPSRLPQPPQCHRGAGRGREPAVD